MGSSGLGAVGAVLWAEAAFNVEKTDQLEPPSEKVLLDPDGRLRQSRQGLGWGLEDKKGFL